MVVGSRAQSHDGEGRLDRRLAAGRLGEREIARLAHHLAIVHEAAPIDPEAARHAGADALSARAKALVAEADRLAGEGAAADSATALREVAALQSRFVARRAGWFADRIAAERVRRGVASLDLDNVFLADSGEIVLRPDAHDAPGGDVCAGVAGLSVSLASHGRTDLAERLLADYADEANDFALYRVVDFHERDRAAARAIWRACTVRDPGTSSLERERTWTDIRRLLHVARATVRRPLLPPVLVGVGGLVASGKSTVARALASRLAAPRVVGDRVREYLEGVPPGRTPSAAQRLAGLTPGFEEAAYDLFFAAGAAVLDSGRPLVLDGGFPTAKRRATARDLAARSGVPFYFIECRVGATIATRRLAERDAADASMQSGGASWRAVYDAYAARFEPPDELPPGEHMVLDTTRPLEESVADVAARLPLWPEGQGG